MRAKSDQPALIVEDSALVELGLLDSAGPEQRKAAGRLLKISRDGDRYRLSRRVHRVGAARLGTQTVVVQPTIPTRTFLGLVHAAYDLRPDQLPVVDLDQAPTPEFFRAALGASLVAAAERVSRLHIHQAYQSRVERLQIVRGRPLWQKEIGRPRDGSIACRYELKTTDTALNRLVLSGLLEARRLLPDGPLRRRAERQAFAWRGLAEPMPLVERYYFIDAHSRLTRQTAHYRDALLLAEALLLGTRTAGDDGGSSLDLPVYDLAVLFERLVERLCEAVAAHRGRVTRPQQTRHDALTDAEGSVYRRIRPDLIVYDGDSPSAVLDAKYKPRYTMGGPEPVVANRISLADAYQLFFYAERLRRLHALPEPLPAYIVSPLIGDETQVPRIARRTVVWQVPGAESSTELQLVVVPLVAVLDVLLDGGSYLEAAMAAPELVSAVGPLSASPPS